MGEAGLPNLVAYSWYGVSVPAATPEPVVARLEAAIARAVADPTIRARFLADGLEPGELNRAQFIRMVSAESELWGRVIAPLKGQIE
jgi:tripartite-type tricarboxylate transporter receptor subunit TctC